MLVLTRRIGQAIRIGSNIEVRVVRVEGDRVVMGIVAPSRIAVVRSELIEQVSGEIREAADTRARLRVMLAPLHAAPDPAGQRPAATEPPPDDPGVA